MRQRWSELRDVPRHWGALGLWNLQKPSARRSHVMEHGAPCLVTPGQRPEGGAAAAPTEDMLITLVTYYYNREDGTRGTH
jgi:hypothetical protein